MFVLIAAQRQPRGRGRHVLFSPKPQIIAERSQRLLCRDEARDEA